MTIGVLEVTLLNASGLANTDFFGGIDPYVLIQYKSQERKSSIARGQGSSPVWNEAFVFMVDDNNYSGEQPKLSLKIMDHDTNSHDDYIDQAEIYLKEVLVPGIWKKVVDSIVEEAEGCGGWKESEPSLSVNSISGDQ